MSANPHSVRVIVRLPYNRPLEGFENPQPVEWNAEKEAILWDVVNRSRQRDSAVPDWQGLSTYLNVPLPYLLYRARQRLEEDLKGLGVGVTTPSTAQPPPYPEEQIKNGERPDLTRKASTRTVDTIKMSSSFRIGSPRIARARLNSLGSGSGPKHLKHLSSSTQTLQNPRSRTLLKAQASSPSDSEPESEEDTENAEAEQQRAEEENLGRRLQHLQKIMTSEALGLVRDVRSKIKDNPVHRGRESNTATSPSPLRQTFQRRDLSSSDFHSNTSSPPGSIPSIPSPPSDSLAQSVSSRQLISGRKSSGLGKKPVRLAVEIVKKDQGSNHGSSASSFDSLSDASTSVLEGALQSQTGTGSRLSHITSQFSSYRRSLSGHQ